VVPKLATHRNDAQLILDVIRATAAWQDGTALDGVIKPLRELIWAVWEQPRLGGTVRGRYPVHAPWSPAARRAYRADPKCPLILEHVTPVRIVVRDLLSRPPANVAALVRVSNRRLEHVTLTPEDNRKLTAAGVGWKLAPGSADPWDRYPFAGIPLRGFAPLRRREPTC
jgi:hypothetical protein